VREAAPQNVTILENVPPAQMPRLMERSLLLLNTSSLEGFPNTFLQAAASRRPVVSLVVQPEYLAESGMGVCAGGDVRWAAESVERIRTERAWAAEMGELGRRWVESHHDAMVIARQLREFFAGAANAKRA
jgi:glycosyltransferase involved in cell wall biosynthesis